MAAIAAMAQMMMAMVATLLLRSRSSSMISSCRYARLAGLRTGSCRVLGCSLRTGGVSGCLACC